MASIDLRRMMLFSAVLRLLLVVYGEWQDAHMEVRYTDVDYLVFSDAASMVASGRSPFERSTYRYSPLLAFLLVPNSILHKSWGKILFSIAVFVNGFVCKNPNLTTANDFFFPGLDKPGNTANQLGSAVTPVFVGQLPGLNTLGVSLARIDFAPNGLVPPHTHPRASEILFLMEGTLYVGFVDSNNKLFTKMLYKGDVFVFPQGLIHFQFNVGKTNAVSISGLGSQNPGVILIANNVFGSNPSISDEVLAKAFQLDKKIVDQLQTKF